MQDPDEVIERALADGQALVGGPELSRSRDSPTVRLASSQSTSAGRHHHVGCLTLGEVENVVDQLLLGARQNSGALCLVDDLAQLLDAADRLAGDDLLDSERPQQERGRALETARRPV